MAGEDTAFTGEARPAKGIKVGFLPQEPKLDPAKDVLGNVEEGVADKRALLNRFNDISARFAEPMDDDAMEKLLAEQARTAGIDRRPEPVGAGPRGRGRDGRAALPAGRRRRHEDLGRRAAPRRALPAAALASRHAAARRAHEPSRRGVGGVARALSQGLHRHRRRRDPRPLLPRQRGGLDPRARPRAGHPLGGQLHVVARAEAGAPRAGGEDAGLEAAHARARAGVGAHGAPRATGEEQGTPQGLRADARRAGPREGGFDRDLRSAGPAARQSGDRGRRPAQGLRREAAVRRSQLQAAAERHRRRDRRQRRRQDHPVPDDHGPGEGRCRHAADRRNGAARVRRSEP